MKTSMNYSIRQSQPQWNSQRKPLLQPQRQTQRQPQRSSQRQPQQSFQRQSNQNKPQNYPKRSSISGTQRTLKDSRQPRGQRLLYSMMRRRRLIKRIFIVLLLYLIVLGIALYFILREPDYCYTESTPSEYQITLCERQKDGAKCSFSVSQCSDGCLLGYRANYYNCPSTCDCAVEGKFENDVRFNPNNIQPVLSLLNNQEDNSFNLFYEGASDIERFWLTYPASTRYRIPYVYSNDVSNTTKDAIDKAIDILSAATCIDFYFRQTEVDYVEFSSREFGCSAFVGRIGGRQTINIGKGCEHPGTILHQMVHTLGFWHEQGRYDRDDHVQIVFGNVANENEIHFSKHKSTFALNYSYDVKSIMHSYGYFYSQNDWPTILDDETTSAVATQRESLTETDIKKINSLYMCKTDEFHSDSLPGDGWGKWSPWQSCSSSCGKGEKVRVRKCLSKAKNDVYSGRCPGSYHEQEDCEAKACSQGMWDEWSSCSTSCGPGVRHRTSCCTPHAKYEEEPCVVVDCPKSENQWGEWTLWQICSRSCGTGYRRRSRECLGKNFVKLNATDCSFTAPGATHYAACATKSCNVKSGCSATAS